MNNDVSSGPKDTAREALERLRSFALLSDDACLEMLDEIPEDVLTTFVSHLQCDNSDVKKKVYSCRVCGKQFKRKWNRDRHLNVHKSGAAQACPVNKCGKEVGDMEELKNHLDDDHGIAHDQKKRKIGIRHDDHYDLLSSRGALVHLDRNGGSLSERAFSLAEVQAHEDCKNCDKPPNNGELGAALQHDGHSDFLFGDMFSCAENDHSHFHIDTKPLEDEEDWNDFFSLLPSN